MSRPLGRDRLAGRALPFQVPQDQQVPAPPPQGYPLPLDSRIPESRLERPELERAPSTSAGSERQIPSQHQQGGQFKPTDWKDDEPAMLALYDLNSFMPSCWEGDQGSAFVETQKVDSKHRDESDPLGLSQSTLLSVNPDLSSEQRSQILLHSKSFDPKVFLSSVHPNASFKDLKIGRQNLKSSLDQRSTALKQLIEAEWDRFVGVKSTTNSVYEEMKQGPFAAENDFGSKILREHIKEATANADAVFNPILEARTKAERLKSTLGVFEKSKFFFNLPGIVGEAVEAGKYDVALQAYNKGRFILSNRSTQLVGLPKPKNADQEQQQKRILEKVWSQVEKIIKDLKITLGARLEDPKRGIDEAEKTIEILLELDPASDPVWIFFDTQHKYIMDLLRTTYQTCTSRIQGSTDLLPENIFTEKCMIQDLKTVVSSFDSLEGESIRENGAGHQIWSHILDMVKELSQVMITCLPNFWQVAKGYMEGKYQKRVDAGFKTRRSSNECRQMTREIVNLYVSLISEFFTLSSSMADPPINPNVPDQDLPPLPSFIPLCSTTPTSCHWLIKTINEVVECVSELSGLDLPSEAVDDLMEMQGSARWRFVSGICGMWLKDINRFYKLESYEPDPDDASVTLYLKNVMSIQRFCCISTYRIAGGSEDRALAGMSPNSSGGGGSLTPKSRDNIGTEFVRKIQSTFFDALYVFLDGLVHAAFSETLFINGLDGEDQPDYGRPKEVDLTNVDIRIIITVSNLTHLKQTLIPKLISQFQTTFQVSLANESKMLSDVIVQLDKILFDDFVKRRSGEISEIVEKGVLRNGIDWANVPRPTDVHPFIFDALLSLVLVHAQVSSTAVSLVSRTLIALVEELVLVSLNTFSKVERFGMGGMLQATLEIEFMHQTLSQHISPTAEQTLQTIYKRISHAYQRAPSTNQAELQNELNGLKQTLLVSRQSTALMFLCFKGPRRGEGSNS